MNKLMKIAFWVIGGLIVFSIIATILFAVWQPFVWEAWFAKPAPAIPIDSGTLATLMTLVIGLLSLGVAAFGWGAFRMLSHLISREVEKGVKLQTSVALTHLFTQLSRVYTTEYEVEPETRKNGYKELAREMSENALEQANKLPEEKYEEAICWAKNHLLYDLIVEGKEQNKPVAQNLRNYIWRKAHKYNDNYHWLETVGLALIYFGEDGKEKANGQSIIREVFARTDIPSAWIEHRRKLYKSWGLNIP